MTLSFSLVGQRETPSEPIATCVSVQTRLDAMLTQASRQRTVPGSALDSRAVAQFERGDADR